VISRSRRRPVVRAVLAAAVLAAAALGSAAPLAATAAELPPSGTVSSVTAVSETGDYIGQGRAVLYERGISVVAEGSSVSISAPGATFDTNLRLALAAPTGEQIAVGSYPSAQRFASVSWPGIDVSSGGRGCNATTGDFEVLDIARTGDVLTRLHLRYEQHCEGRTPALFGEVRYQAPPGAHPLLVSPGTVQWPKGYPGVPSRPVPLMVRNTSAADVTLGTPTVGGTHATSFSVVSSTCPTSLAPESTCAVNVRTTPAVAGSLSAELILPTSGAAGDLVVPLRSEGTAGYTSWDMVSEPGDYIGGGRTYRWTPSTATITAVGDETHVTVSVDAGTERFTATFVPGANDVLLPGVTYTGALRYPFQGPKPGLDVGGSGRGCNALTGEFTVQRSTTTRTG